MNLLASFETTGRTLDVFQRALSVVQDNVANVNTPGYARQSLALEALPVDGAGDLAGGVAGNTLIDSRSQYADEEVQRQTQTLGRSSAQAESTASLQNLFDATGGGVADALNSLFQSFSAWSTNPNSTEARSEVIDSATETADAIQGLATSIEQNSSSLDGQISSTVDQINTLAGQVQQYNEQRLRQTAPDPAQDAHLESTLEDLSQLTGFTTVRQSDGTVTVLAAGDSPLVMGTQTYQLSVDTSVDSDPAPANPNSPPTVHILDWRGQDITAQATNGRLGGLVDTRNRLIGSLLGNGQDPGALNRLAAGLADTVNQILESGTVSSEPGAAQGVALFTYDHSDPTAAAGTLRVNPDITPQLLAPVNSSGANGNANLLASLANPTGNQGKINGMSLSQYMAQITSTLGKENQVATQNQQTQQQVLAQAKTLRDNISGVSLDQEAVSVLQFQRAYQAAAQVLTVLNTLADTTLSMIRA